MTIEALSVLSFSLRTNVLHYADDLLPMEFSQVLKNLLLLPGLPENPKFEIIGNHKLICDVKKMVKDYSEDFLFENENDFHFRCNGVPLRVSLTHEHILTLIKGDKAFGFLINSGVDVSGHEHYHAWIGS